MFMTTTLQPSTSSSEILDGKNAVRWLSESGGRGTLILILAYIVIIFSCMNNPQVTKNPFQRISTNSRRGLSQWRVARRVKFGKWSQDVLKVLAGMSNWFVCFTLWGWVWCMELQRESKLTSQIRMGDYWRRRILLWSCLKKLCWHSGSHIYISRK